MTTTENIIDGRSIYAVASRIDIYEQDPEWLHPRTNLPLIATLLAGDVNFGGNSTSGWVEVIIESRHKTATDIEHDASKVFYMRLVNPSLVSYFAGRMEYTATAVEGYWYDAGVDPTKQEKDGIDYSEIDPCSFETCDGHLYAPHMPPKRSRFPRLVRFEISPSKDS